MIIREILDEPELLIGLFDFFNDATDTMLWLKSLRTDRADRIAERLNAAFRKWMAGNQTKAVPEECELCGDQGLLLLHARCHLTAPLRASIDGNVLTLRCYVPECSRDVAKFEIVRKLPNE